MPYLRCSSCGRNQLYSPKRFELRGCPDCGSDLAYDRPLSLDDRPPSRPARGVPEAEWANAGQLLGVLRLGRRYDGSP
jgi:predicted  nucleic acid-binding Zn-ribbon protein